MGNTCGCVDPAEKEAEVQVEKKKNQNVRADQHRNYRDSTLSAQDVNQQIAKGATAPGGPSPQIFQTEDPYLIEL